MTEENTITSQLSVAMTATGMTQITGGSTMTSSSSRGTEFYFQCAVLVIGVVGTATNALILYALVASKQHKKHVLIVHQNALDMFSSILMVIINAAKLCNIRLTGSVGYWLCALLLSDSLVWWGTIGSVINLAIITVDRYLKIVHSVWSKKKPRKWMIYSAVAFTWIVSFMFNVVPAIPTSRVVNRACYAYTIWKNKTAHMIYFVSNFVLFYVIIILIFIICYWRILVVIRRQARVMAAHSAADGPSTAQNLSVQMQSNVIKTMIFVSAFYAISWLPSYVYFLLVTLSPNPTISDDFFYYGSIILAFLYMCTNPFIYATKFEPVKQVLLRLILCKNISE